MKKCLITLTGQGDTNLVLISKEIFEWIVAPMEFLLAVGSIDDPTTPLILQEHMKSRGYEPLCNVTCGSPDNDKALFVLGCADLDDENVRSFGSVRELNKYCKKHKVDIEYEWEGGIY